MSEFINKEQLKAALKVLGIGIWSDIADIVDGLLAADVAPVVHGHWCEDEFDVWCSNCYCAYPKDGTGIAGWRKISKYCDNCGAKMDESEV